MRILVIVPENPPKRILVRLHTHKLVGEVKELIKRGKHIKAIEVAIRKGRLKRKVGVNEVENLNIDLILRDNGAHWDVKENR